MSTMPRSNRDVQPSFTGGGGGRRLTPSVLLPPLPRRSAHLPPMRPRTDLLRPGMRRHIPAGQPARGWPTLPDGATGPAHARRPADAVPTEAGRARARQPGHGDRAIAAERCTHEHIAHARPPTDPRPSRPPGAESDASGSTRPRHFPENDPHRPAGPDRRRRVRPLRSSLPSVPPLRPPPGAPTGPKTVAPPRP